MKVKLLWFQAEDSFGDLKQDMKLEGICSKNSEYTHRKYIISNGKKYK